MMYESRCRGELRPDWRAYFDARRGIAAACALVLLGSVFCVVGDVTLAGTAPARSAVIANGDFEAGLRGWLVQGTVGLSSVAHQGKRSAEVGGGHTRDSALSTTF